MQNTMEVKDYRQLSSYQNSLKKNFFCVQQKEKTHTGLEQHEGE